MPIMADYCFSFDDAYNGLQNAIEYNYVLVKIKISAIN